ncbi:1397_t:CDS:2, partial [Racocetra persica]
ADLNPNHVNYNLIIDTIGVFIFASMAVTSNLTAYTLLAKRRKDYWQEIHKKAQEIKKQCNGKLTYIDLENIMKLDSFIKEMLTESYNFITNEFQVPHGRHVYLDIRAISFNEKVHDQNPQKFNGFLHSSTTN